MATVKGGEHKLVMVNSLYEAQEFEWFSLVGTDSTPLKLFRYDLWLKKKNKSVVIKSKIGRTQISQFKIAPWKKKNKKRRSQ